MQGNSVNMKKFKFTKWSKFDHRFILSHDMIQAIHPLTTIKNWYMFVYIYILYIHIYIVHIYVYIYIYTCIYIHVYRLIHRLMMMMINCFVVSLTNERCLALYPAGTIIRDPHHRESLTGCKQDLNMPRIWVQTFLNEVMQ